MVVKYNMYDEKYLKVKMDAIRQEPRYHVQNYYDRLECLFVKGRILNLERRRFLVYLKPKFESFVLYEHMWTWMTY